MAKLNVEIDDTEAQEKLAAITCAAKVAQKAVDNLTQSLLLLGEVQGAAHLRIGEKEEAD